MDAPNTPNPANPNAQDQSMNTVQGPANQAQGPAIQNQGQGPVQVDQNVPVQPPLPQAPAPPCPVGPVVPAQPAPAQPVPIGLVAPAPQVILSKLDRKKPEFSGKPEEDVESHLLSTRDWMEAHNFPNEVKVRHFCLMLTGEARLRYESLAPLDDD